ELTHSGFGFTLKELQAGRAGVRHVNDEPGDWLYAWAPIGIGSWGTAIRWPYPSLTADARRQSRITIAILVGCALLVGFIAIGFAAYLTKQLAATQAKLLDTERFTAMGKTAAAIAHELKNALNGLGMCVDLVLA